MDLSFAIIETRRLLALGYLAGVLFHLPAQAQPTIDWNTINALSEADQTAIVELMREVGMPIGEVREQQMRPLARTVYVVRSPVIADNMRRSWSEVQVCRSSEEHCKHISKLVKGDWAIASELTRQERWQFTDTDLAIEVELGTAISYAEAETIVHAIHRGQLDFVPGLKDFARPFDARTIRSITTRDPIAREFMVLIDEGNSGYDLTVRLGDDGVLVLEAGFWIA